MHRPLAPPDCPEKGTDMKRLAGLSLLVLGLAETASPQGLSTLSGAVTDPTGSVIPSAKVVIVNADNASQRETTTDAQGRYVFSQVQPGAYNLSISAPGFNPETRNSIRLLVNTPSVVDIQMKIGPAVATTVVVSEEASQVNTGDASIGNAIGGSVITQLPFESRNVVGLLAIQPGVVYLGETTPGKLNDARSGAVDGGKSDQGNVTLDGVDVNDQQNRASFTSVLGVTLDSVQEFRTTTTNAGAEYGHSSGAQVTMVTRSGTNTVHGSAYEFLRNTDTSANSFFNNSAGVARPKLNRNVYGASLGGPLKRDKLFLFGNYEGRKDASEQSVLRTVPTASFRQGIIYYGTTKGTIGTITPAYMASVIPGGEDPAVLNYLQQFPLPNDSTTGDGLNTAGFRFNASAPLRFNTYIAKADYQINAKNSFFIRGNLQNDNYANGAPEFPGSIPSSVYLNNSKGIATGLTTIFSPSLISTLRYGLTRAGIETTGVLSSSYADPTYGSVSTLYATTTGALNIIPTHDIHEDLAWTKGGHTISFGGEVLLIRNHYDTNANSFSTAQGDGPYLSGGGKGLLPSDAAVSNVTIQNIGTLSGLLTKNTLKINYDLNGNPLPLGATVDRLFGENHYDLYGQDSWKARPGLTVSAGVRLSLNPPLKELNGYNVDSTEPLAQWLADRAGLAASGQSGLNAGLISYDLASKTGRGLYAFMTDWAPRVAVAYSPQGSSGISRFLFGGPNQTSIRAGWGIYYDAFGETLAKNLAASVGFATTVGSGPNQAIGSPTPLFQGSYTLPPLSAFPTPPAGGFPQTIASGALLQAQSLDDGLKAPYTENLDFSIQRQLKGGFMVQAAYVNRGSHRSLIGEDMATPTNLVDTKSGMSYDEAVAVLAPYVFAKAAASSVPAIPFFEDLWPAAAGNGLTATQSMYNNAFKGQPGNWTTSLLAIDRPVTAAAAASAPFSGCNQAGVLTSTQLPCSRLGPYTMWSPQFIALIAYRTVGGGNYNGMHLTVRKALSRGYQFDFNYTWSKCIDLGSSPESSGASSGFILNPFAQNLMKGVCNYDATHVFSALGVAELPFGSGKPLLNSRNKFVNAIFGGWQLTGVLTASSGFPVSVVNGGVYPTEWNSSGYATQIGVVPAPSTTKNAPSASVGTAGGPNIFALPALTFAGYGRTLAGAVGQRNGIRGQGPFSLDTGLGKKFYLFNYHDQPHTLQFRAEGFNITNTARFDAGSANLTIQNQAKFGQYTQTFGSPRVFQFSARYEF
jgi:hypothetical protein